MRDMANNAGQRIHKGRYSSENKLSDPACPYRKRMALLAVCDRLVIAHL